VNVAAIFFGQMRTIFTIAVVAFLGPFGYAQSKAEKHFEFYLLKTSKPNKDGSKELRGEFLFSEFDLDENPIIRDNEILEYVRFADTTKYQGQIFVDVRHRIKVSQSVIDRINNLNIPLCCGRQFALVLNKKIIYGGYFWNIVSSFGCNAITAFATGGYIEIRWKLPGSDQQDKADPRDNLKLIDGMKETGRIRN
jgi:hypothetical protein